jgi:hypothetical protein
MHQRMGQLAGRHHSVWAAGLLFAAAIGSGCVASATTTPSSRAIPSASTSATLAATPVGSPTPFAPPTSLPSGEWTGIEWTRISGQAEVWAEMPLPDESSDPNVTESGWTVIPWSRGYIAFDTITTFKEDGSSTSVTRTQSSTDGLHWTAGGSWSKAEASYGYFGIGGLVEGPGSVLAVSGDKATCGGYPGFHSEPIAVSRDGVTWTSIAPDLGSIQWIDGGSAGYIAAGVGGVFTSTDGVDWKRTDLTARTFKGLDGVTGATAFDGGFVLAGVAFGPETEGCGSGPTLLSPALWWSPDGRTWTRSSLPNPISGTNATMSVTEYDGKILRTSAFVQDDNGDSRDASWVSEDGHTWIPFSESGGLPSSLHGRVTQSLSLGDGPSTTVCVVRSDLSTAELVQTGDVPDWSRTLSIIGPNGVVAVDDSGNTYFGIPVAGD